MMLVPNANITYIAKRLEKNGFIEKQPEPKDKRVTLLSITAKGIQILVQIEAEKNQRLKSMLRGFPQKEKRNF